MFLERREKECDGDMNTTMEVNQYIRDKNISIDEIANATGVDKMLFSEQEHRGFLATEFLEVCDYLKVDPWKFFSKRE